MNYSRIFFHIGKNLTCFYKFLFYYKAVVDFIYSGYYAGLFNKKLLYFYMEYPCRTILGYQYIEMGENFVCKSGLRLEVMNLIGHTPILKIGNNVQFNNHVHIGCVNSIIISDNVLIGSNVFITDHSHGNVSNEELSIPPGERSIYSKGPIFIDENVWIGENVTILPNVVIGKNIIVGANSVVTHSFPDNCVIAGNPAKIIKKL